MAAQGREDVTSNMANAQQTANLGFQGALDVFGQSLPAQTDVFQQGNVGAQQAILAGLPQQQNALLGNQIDYSQMQPFEIQQPDTSFFNQTLPQIQNQQAQAEQDATLNGGLGPYSQGNSMFNGMTGPFQTVGNQAPGRWNGNPLGGRFNTYRDLK